MADDDKPKEDVQSFTLERELAEVYLLLDSLSGRPDKNLSIAFNGADLPPVMSVGGAASAAAGRQAGEQHEPRLCPCLDRRDLARSCGLRPSRAEAADRRAGDDPAARERSPQQRRPAGQRPDDRLR